MTEITLRIILAIIIGGVIGYEREYTNSPAGFRTHILVALGACIISLIQVQMVEDTISIITANEVLANAYKVDMGRLGAQVISGIGFLGAGTILQTKGSIKGLTTAASICVVGCLGLCIGLGYYRISLIGATAIFIVLSVFKYIENKFMWSKDTYKIHIEYKKRENIINDIQKNFFEKGIKVINIQFLCEEDNDEETCILTIKKTKGFYIEEVLLKCSTIDDVVNIYEVK